MRKIFINFLVTLLVFCFSVFNVLAEEINQDIVESMEKILSNFLVKLNENASEELSPEEANIVESELKRLGYM